MLSIHSPPKKQSNSQFFPTMSATLSSVLILPPRNTIHFQIVSTSSRRRPNPQTQKSKPRKLKSKNTNPKTLPLSTSLSESGDATSFTSLPPLDDSEFTSQSFSQLVKLSDATLPLININKPVIKKPQNNLLNAEEEEEEEEEEENASGIKFDYGKFELYEIDSDNEFDIDDDQDYEGDEIVFENGEEEEEEIEIEVKEKGVPAVMRCFDRAKIFAKAGDGGNGAMAFRREKFVPFGGPSGGDGGRGGHIYVEVDGALNSLLPFRKSLHYKAGRGSHGKGSQMHGAKGKDVVIKVPPGTVVRESEGDVLLELLYPGQKALLIPGGRGGKGNAAFKTNLNRVPKIAEIGEQGPEMWLELELKLVADVGIVGAPNAGKSTLLSVVSAAQPTIANYPFTTLLPNLGVVSFDYNATMVVADLPGLLEGAHRGFGLGHEFLRHTERCSVLVHIVDGSSQQPVYEFDAVRLELEMFNPELSVKPFIVAFNKMDLPEASENWPSFKEELQARGIKPFCMSAVTTSGTQEVINFAYELVQENKASQEDGVVAQVDLNHVADMLKKQRASPINEFDISRDIGNSTWHVEGAGLQRFVQMTNWRYEDSERRFQHVLEACGVNKSLIKLGVKEGDTVVVGEMELVWHDAADYQGPRSRRKRATVESVE